MLIALIGISVFSILGMYMAFNATAEVRISDNFERHVEASYAALAGLNHARELPKDLQFNDLLTGPDGTFSNNSFYLTQARTYPFRNLVSWSIAAP